MILGPPGSGKSTLVRCLALALSAGEPSRRPLAVGLPDATVPILLALKTYAARLKSDPSLKLDVFLAEEVGSQLPGLDEVLAGGGALVLLDGLDEVFDEQHRCWVSAEVSRLMSLHPRARFVLTSRPHGYRAAPLSGAVPLFDMVPFDDERIRAFFGGWFTALARQGLAAERRRTPEQRAEALAGDVLSRPRIRSLAENPMLCTLIVLVHRSRSGRLPERRVKFYRAAVAVLTEHWEKAKRYPKQETKLDFPEPELMVGVLAEVAWRAQTELESREIPAEVLEAWIEGALADDPEWSGKRKSAARDLLQVIQGRTGLLVDAGGERYQFVHLSLQEYLVAFYLLDRLDDAQSCRVVRYFMHAPEWEEILRLTIGAAPRVRADALVRAVLEEPTSEWEEPTRRDLRFVCRAMADRPNVSEAVLADVRSRWLKILEARSDDDEAALTSAQSARGSRRGRRSSRLQRETLAKTQEALLGRPARQVWLLRGRRLDDGSRRGRALSAQGQRLEAGRGRRGGRRRAAGQGPQHPSAQGRAPSRARCRAPFLRFVALVRASAPAVDLVRALSWPPKCPSAGARQPLC